MWQCSTDCFKSFIEIWRERGEELYWLRSAELPDLVMMILQGALEVCSFSEG